MLNLLAGVAALVASASSAADLCAGANNATGTTLCGCGKFVPLAVPVLNLGCVGPAGSQGGLIKSVTFAVSAQPAPEPLRPTPPTARHCSQACLLSPPVLRRPCHQRRLRHVQAR